ncbi:MAG: acetylornithine transaminase, partial [Myxococcota bacterium]|nr:acetylornithine transaminase [Myxococcota bacterium]
METLFPDLSTDEVLTRARAHYTPNYRQAPFVLVRGEGVWVWDRDGTRYLDFIAGIAVSSLGHGHPRLVAAIREQADKLIHTSGLYHHEPAVALMDMLTQVSFADRVFFGNSGAEANEAALKLCRRYWTTVKERPEKTEVLAFESSFHGRTFATLTATGQAKYQKGFEPLLPGFHYAPFADLDAAQAALEGAGGKIGTVIIEPIQCEGGLHVPSNDYLLGLRKLCDAHEALLVFDEVQTGVGRTGEWFCYEISSATPDVMTLAKGLGGGVPVGAMCCTEEVSQAFVPGAHASTFGGNPLATRAALEVLRTIRDDRLLDHVYETGE